MEISWTNLTSTFESLKSHSGQWWIVSPFLTTTPPIEEQVGIKVLIRGEVADFLEGSSSIRVVQDLLASGAEIRTLPGLNAKVYMREDSKNSFACIGSANLTNGGMKNNIEIMSTPVVAAWEFIQRIYQLWDEARPLTPQEAS